MKITKPRFERWLAEDHLGWASKDNEKVIAVFAKEVLKAKTVHIDSEILIMGKSKGNRDFTLHLPSWYLPLYSREVGTMSWDDVREIYDNHSFAEKLEEKHDSSQ